VVLKHMANQIVTVQLVRAAPVLLLATLSLELERLAKWATSVSPFKI